MPRSGSPRGRLSPSDRQRAELDDCRRIGGSTVDWLLAFLTTAADEVVTVREAAATAADLSCRAVILRHDIDTDIENAVRLAALEEAFGLRASYYVHLTSRDGCACQGGRKCPAS